MAHGKAIEMFLTDGTANGVVTAEIVNWSGKAIKIPRVEVSACTREDIRLPGVYFLLCKPDDVDSRNAVYVGEAENVYTRLKQHIQDYNNNKASEQYFWHTAIVFVGTDLNKTLIRYLENRLFQIATECAQYRMLTKNTYSRTVIKEAQKAAMEEFIDNIKILMGALGYKFLDEIAAPTKNVTLYQTTARGSNATGFVSADGFVVVKGSRIVEDCTPSFSTKQSYFNLRNTLIQEKIIIENLFVEDYTFASPSAAASVVIGNPSNGRIEWKSNGIPLKSIEE